MKDSYDTVVWSLSSSTSPTSSASGTVVKTTPVKKKWHSKTRTGCVRVWRSLFPLLSAYDQQCKERRIKVKPPAIVSFRHANFCSCDETHPQCIRCRKSGFKCSGYKIPQPRIFELPSQPAFDSSIDKQSFDYFISEGAMVLSTYQPTSRPFWLRLAPQLTHVHPAVKHGVIALGAIQSRIQRSTPDQLLNIQRPEISGQALVHLSKGMRSLSSASPDSVSMEVSLACCMLFLAATIWLDRAAAPVIHIDAAQKILRSYQNAVASSRMQRSSVIDDVYLPEYQSLVVNALAFSDGYPRSNSNISADYALDFRLDEAGTFNNFDDAFDALNNVIRCIIRLNAGHSMRRLSDKVSAALDTFLRSLQQLRRKHYPANTDDADDAVPGTREQAYQQLLMYHRVATIMFQAGTSGGELAFDAYNRDFLHVVTECERLLLEDVIAMPSNASNLRTSLGLLPPLFFAATKCRNRVIRHKALDVLHGALRSERNWTSCMATAMARFVIEEEGQFQDSL